MSTTESKSVANTHFTPTPQQQEVLDVFADEYQVNPKLIREITGLNRQRVNDVLNDLESAGWIESRTRGLYRLRYDGTGYVTQTIEYQDTEDGDGPTN